MRAYAEKYPYAWREIEGLRAHRGTDGLPDWPDTCYIPIAGAHATVSHGAPVVMASSEVRMRWAHDAAIMAGLAAWRIGKGVYRWDADLAHAVVATPMDGAMPVNVLLRLPEWCIYHEVPPGILPADIAPIYGAFVHLEHDTNTGMDELRILLDTGDDLVPVPLDLRPETIAEALARLARDIPGAQHAMDEILATVQAIVALTLYVESDQADIVGPEPGNPAPKRTKRGLRVFARDAPREWDVGWRTGQALRGARREPGDAGDGTHASPRAHLRRAHWHHFWTGPRDGDRRLIVRWLHPILVGAVADAPAVVRPVKL